MKIQEGSISTGTLRTSDLLLALVFELKRLQPTNPIIKKVEEMEDHEGMDASFLLYEELYPALEELAPEGMYFGSHPGDGADIGWWKHDE